MSFRCVLPNRRHVVQVCLCRHVRHVVQVFITRCTSYCPGVYYPMYAIAVRCVLPRCYTSRHQAMYNLLSVMSSRFCFQQYRIFPTHIVSILRHVIQVWITRCLSYSPVAYSCYTSCSSCVYYVLSYVILSSCTFKPVIRHIVQVSTIRDISELVQVCITW